jgi:hypothetical protein
VAEVTAEAKDLAVRSSLQNRSEAAALTSATFDPCQRNLQKKRSWRALYREQQRKWKDKSQENGSQASKVATRKDWLKLPPPEILASGKAVRDARRQAVGDVGAALYVLRAAVVEPTT